MKFAQLQYILLLLIAFNNSLFGQQKDILSNTLITPKEYYLQVKQFGEFIDRFNYKSDWKGNLITDEFKKVVPRKNYILFLVNNEDSRLINPKDSSYRALCSDFIAFIDDAKNPQNINLYSGQVKAFVDAQILYKGVTKHAKLELIPEVLPDRSAKWVVNSVETDCFAMNADSLLKHFISPNSHETSFINIKKLNSISDPTYLLSKSTASTRLFMNEIENKHITINDTEKITFRISFTGWEIVVEEFVRSTNNSGWLISDIKKL